MTHSILIERRTAGAGISVVLKIFFEKEKRILHLQVVCQHGIGAIKPPIVLLSCKKNIAKIHSDHLFFLLSIILCTIVFNIPKETNLKRMLPNAFCLCFGGLINNMYHTTHHLRYIPFIFVTCININILLSSFVQEVLNHQVEGSKTEQRKKYVGKDFEDFGWIFFLLLFFPIQN